MSLNEFEEIFNKNNYYDNELFEWFDKNYKEFSNEFEILGINNLNKNL